MLLLSAEPASLAVTLVGYAALTGANQQSWKKILRLIAISTVAPIAQNPSSPPPALFETTLSSTSSSLLVSLSETPVACYSSSLLFLVTNLLLMSSFPQHIISILLLFLHQSHLEETYPDRVRNDCRANPH